MGERRINLIDAFLDRIGQRLARKLDSAGSGYDPYTPSDLDSLCATLRSGDVILVEGRERISTAIKYLTQSTWSHAALFIGDALPPPADGSERPRLIEVNLGQGCVASPLGKYATYNTRICRPSGLDPEGRAAVVAFMVARLGLKYDLRNIIDLLRYFVPTPPVPVRWRRRMIGLGAGDPTRAICSSLIAQAFQSVHYPILPRIDRTEMSKGALQVRREVLHIRHHSLFVPRDFDMSPWFDVVKPAPLGGADHHRLTWAADDAVAQPSAGAE